LRMKMGSMPSRLPPAIIDPSLRAPSPASRQISGCDDYDLVIPPTCPIIYIAGGALNPDPVTPEDFNHFAQIRRIAELRQRLQLDPAYDSLRPVPHQEYDFAFANLVTLPCSR